MKVCLAFFPIDDMGGLINNNNNLCAGFQELGHDTFSCVMLPREFVPRNGVSGGRGTKCIHSELEYDQRRGYSWPANRCIPYRGRSLKPAVEFLNQFDLVVWQIPVPTKRKENRGNIDWLGLYSMCKVPQVAYIHDGNFIDGYPWLSMVAPFLRGVGCVNHAALNSCASLSVPYSLTPSPQRMSPPPDISESTFNLRSKGFLSLQTFKAWKHVPELVAAIPYTTSISCHLAGKGIDYYYLTSSDKCKWPGIWDAACLSGMSYHDVITNTKRDDILRGLTCLVDPSWSKKYAAIGGHYNRVVVEAIKCGAVPIVRPLGISTNLSGQGEVFVAGENCLAIPQNISAAGYGALLEEYCNLSYFEYRRIIKAGLSLLPMWDRRSVAQTFIDLSEGKADYHGSTSKRVLEGAEKAIGEFFEPENA